MSLILSILIGVIGIIIGLALIVYSYPLTQLFGHNSLAERYLGTAGTYTMWKLLGILVIALSIWYVFR